MRILRSEVYVALNTKTQKYISGEDVRSQTCRLEYTDSIDQAIKFPRLLTVDAFHARHPHVPLTATRLHVKTIMEQAPAKVYEATTRYPNEKFYGIGSKDVEDEDYGDDAGMRGDDDGCD